MAEQNVTTNGGGGNVEGAKNYIETNFNVSQFTMFAEALWTVKEHPGGFTLDELSTALADLMGESAAVADLVLHLVKNPDCVGLVRDLIHMMNREDAKESGAGLELLKLMRDLANVCREAEQGVDHA
jgi:hypothetical protein